jgi:hypothetical protein
MDVRAVTLRNQESGKAQPTWRGHPVGPVEKRLSRRLFYTPDRTRNLGCPLDSLGVRVRELRQALTAGSRSGMGTHANPASTPYWITFELPAIDMSAASVGLLNQVVAGLR